MKRTLKKVCSLLTAFVMLFSLSLNVSAQESIGVQGVQTR